MHVSVYKLLDKSLFCFLQNKTQEENQDETSYYGFKWKMAIKTQVVVVNDGFAFNDFSPVICVAATKQG